MDIFAEHSITYRKHLVGLVENEHLHVVGLQDATLDHVLNTTWSTNDDLWAILKSLHILADIGTTDAGVTVNVHEIADGDNDLLDLLSQLASWGKDQSLASLEVLVDLLQAGDGEGSGLASARLGLSDHIGSYEEWLAGSLKSCWGILTLDDWHNSALLNSRRPLETIGVDT